jgi:hypothetical protein
MAMPGVVTQQSTENMAYVRRLLRQTQPGFSAALESALLLAEPESASSEMSRKITAAEGS